MQELEQPPIAGLLVSHGSSDPRHQQALEQLAEQVRAQLPGALIGTACLEVAIAPLHEQIVEFATQVLTSQGNRLQILPLFLLPGVHVIDDIPAEIALAQAQLGDRFQLELKPYLGSNPDLKRLLQQPVTAGGTQILFSHGTRRPRGNQVVEELATGLGATPAYWSLDPNLETVVAELASQGYTALTIRPYFLFPGTITDTIARTLTELSQAFPQLRLQLTAPLTAYPELAYLLSREILK